MGCLKLDILKSENTGLKVVYPPASRAGRKDFPKQKVVQWFTGVDPLAEDAPDWTPFRYGFNNPILYIDPDGLFEDKATAKQYAKDHGIKTGWFRDNKIVKQSDGTYAIENKKEHSSTFQDKTLANVANPDGVYTGAMVAANDVMQREINYKKNSFLGIESNSMTGITNTYRDGSTVFIPLAAGTAPDVGPGKILKGYEYVKTIGKKYDVFEKVVKSEKLGGQARAVYTKVNNLAGKTVRFFKDSFKRDGRHYERANKYPHNSRSRKRE